MRLNFRKNLPPKGKSPFQNVLHVHGSKFYVLLFPDRGRVIFCFAAHICRNYLVQPIDELLIFPPTFFVKRPTAVNYITLPNLLQICRFPLSRYIFNSLFVTIVTTVIYIIISAMAAFVLSKATFRGRNLIFMIIQFALMFNAYTLAVPQYLIVSGMKIIDSYWVYILPQLAATLGVFLMKQYIEGYVPDALLEAASIDVPAITESFGK